jgi:protein N-terminal methyltransferase
MANVIAAEGGDGERPGERGGEDGEENWEDEVDMDVFYSDAVKYWEGIPATVEGMLGGFGRHSTLDVNNSKRFLLPLIKGTSAIAKPNRALDCGSGIGRVTKRLLLPLFTAVDMVEQNETFLEKSKLYLGEPGGRVERRIAKGLQEFVPEKGRYDVIWCQWVLSHLSNEDLVGFLRSCAQALPQGSGVIVLKENIALEDDDVFDENDSSVTRSLPSFYHIFSAAELEIVAQDVQKDWPKELFPIRMFALR